MAPTFALRLQARGLDHAMATVRLRAALKALRRQFGLTCVEVKQEGDAP